MSKEAYVEMKIKEKGLKGKAAVVKRDYITRKGFDAFREMRLAAGGKDGKKEPEKKAPPEIFVSFFGKNLRVLDEGGGSVAPEDVPRVRGSALRFTGCGGEVSFDDIKRPLKERFSRAPFIKFTKGDDAGLVGFDKALDEEDVAFVKEKIPTLNGNPVTWELPRGTSFPVSCVEDEYISPFQRRKSTRLGLSEPTPRQGAHQGQRTEPLEVGVVVVLAVGAGDMVVVAGGQIGALSLEQVVTVTIVRARMARTSRLEENARGQWNQMGGTTRECGDKLCLPSQFLLHRRNQRPTAESREYHNWQKTWLRFVFL